MSELTPSEQIDQIIMQHSGWKGTVIDKLRDVIVNSDPSISEEIKWKMPTRPEGLPVWVHTGIVCYVEIWKDNVKLIFAKGSQLTDQHKLFNARLNSSAVRAIELHEGDSVDENAVRGLVAEAVQLNAQK